MKKIIYLSNKVLMTLCLCVFLFSAVSCKEKKIAKINQEKIDEAINSINIPTTIHEGLELPTKFNDVSITWDTTYDWVLDKNQVFYTSEETNCTISLTGVFSYNGQNVNKEYSVSIDKKSDTTCDTAWATYQISIPDSTSSSFALNNDSVNDCTVTYFSTQQNIISNNGIVTQNTNENFVMFYSFVKSNDVTIIYAKQIKVNPLGTKTDQEILEDTINSLSIPTSTHTGLDLPSKIGDVLVSWSSDESLILDKNQVFYVNEGSSYEITLFGTFQYNRLETSKKYTISVEETKDGVCNAAWDIFKRKIPSATIRSFSPYTKSFNDCIPTYRSLNTDVISNTGVVKQSKEDHVVLFNCYVKSPSAITVIYPTQITINAYTDTQRIDFTKEWLNKQVEEIKISEGSSFPYYFEEYNTYINWYSLSFGLITSSGVIIRPLVPTDVSFGCTITCNDTSATMEFSINEFGGDITMEEQLKLWGTGVLPTFLRGTKNTVGSDDHLTEQVRTNSNGVLNFITGGPIEIDKSYFVDYQGNNLINHLFGSSSKNTSVHPEVPQAVLDELFYEGYKMPNEQNVLWIVVHESGMPHNGQNAELLAKLQYNNAYTTASPREASWHYQVDEGKIYQSFDDNVICWHAGDGTSSDATGNNNGIGIEMCINPDGNYDGAMHMDAKLIAYLMHKYNLTLDNVKRHYDFSGKICPNYMIQKGRWTEFLELVNREYVAYSYYEQGVRISWSVSKEGSDETSAALLSQYFTKGTSGLYFNKPVVEEVKLLVNIKIEYNDLVYTNSKEITLKPNGSKDE